MPVFSFTKLHFTTHHTIARSRYSSAALIAVLLCTLLSNASASVTSIHGKTITGAPGITETVAQMMARAARISARGHSRHPRKPLLRPDRRHLSQNRRAASRQTSRAVVRGSSPHTPQVVGTTFNGATGPNETGAFPPDTMGAAGPTQFIVAINGRFRSFSKSGAADGALNINSDDFFAPVVTPPTASEISFTSDPHIRYDRLSGRWFISMIDVTLDAATGDITRPNRVLLAVSSGPIIASTSSFTLFQFQGDTTNFADYDTLGIDANALYIGANMFTLPGSYVGTNGYVIRKSSVLGAGPIVVTQFSLVPDTSSPGPFTPQGVDNYDPAATTGYFIGVDNLTFGTLMLRRVSNPGGTPTISGNIPISVSSTAYPLSVPHLGNTGGSNGTLDALDDRLFAAHIRNGRLWTAHNIQVDSSGAASSTGGRDGCRWYELQNLDGSPSVVQSGTIFDPAASNPKFYWIPSIMVSGQGHAAMGFSTAGAAYHINACTVGRLVGDTPGSMQTPVDYTASSTSYNPPSDPGPPRRWGDYSFTCVDPNDDMTMWTIQEWCNGTNTYGVEVAKLIAPPPATPSSTSPASVATGQSSVNVTIIGTSTSGSGFFDPGTNPQGTPFNHLSATVGGGVTVNSVTYVDPTQVTLNISTVGVAAGSYDVTITNPDGQSRTGTAVLQVTSASSTFKITGLIRTSNLTPIPGVSVAINPVPAGVTSPVTTDSSGAYQFTNVPPGTYTLTPSKAGYEFSPASQGLSVTNADRAANFVGTAIYSITGRISDSSGVALLNVSLALSPAPAGVTTPVLTNSAGYFTFSRVPDGSYTITPSKSGMQFKPPSRSVTVSGANVGGQNFIGYAGHKVSGRVSNSNGTAISGVTVQLDAGGPTMLTNSAGYFTFTNVADGTHTLTPSKSGLAFTPISRTVNVSGADISGQNFIGSTGHKVSGRIATSSGVAISGVTVQLDSGPTVTTNSAGYYTFTNVADGSHTLTPSKSGMTFTPTNRTVTVNGADVSGQNFVGS